MTTPTVLVVEDEASFVEALSIGLRREGFHVEVAMDGFEALERFDLVKPDLVLLDVMLPRISGIDVCRQLRKRSQVPIIMVTAKGAEIDTVVGLEVGADDYVTKPFHTKVLLQRVKALQRRAENRSEPGDVIETQGVRIDRVRHQASIRGRAVDLTPTEFRLLECLLRQPGRAFTRHQLMDAAIGEGSIVLERTIDVHIKTLRRKLDAPELIETVRGVGYRFRELASVIV
jgi:two-component system phosphate regulon response regulator PhoB